MTVLTSLLEKIVGRQQERERARVTSYREMVSQIATGKEVNADDVDRLLTLTGKTTDDLAAAVELHQHRLALRAQLDQRPEIEKERGQLGEQIRKANAALQAAEAQHEEVVMPLRARLDHLKELARETDRAQVELVDGCPYEELLAESQEVYAKQRDACERANKLRAEIEMYRGHAQANRERADQMGKALRADDVRPRQKELRAMADRGEAKAAALATQLAEFEKETVDLAQREHALREQMLVP
jgi:hypothetical protein